MKELYTASVYSGQKQIAEKAGDDLDQLYTWMLVQGQEQFGDIHGEIIENSTQKVVRAFRKCPIE